MTKPSNTDIANTYRTALEYLCKGEARFICFALAYAHSDGKISKNTLNYCTQEIESLLTPYDSYTSWLDENHHQFYLAHRNEHALDNTGRIQWLQHLIAHYEMSSSN